MNAVALLTLSVLISIVLAKYDYISLLMEDVGRKMPNEPCYTPYDLEDKFTRACKKTGNDKIFCEEAWDAFIKGFGFKDPNTVTEDDYNSYFEVLPVINLPNSSVFWSGVPNVVEEISKHHNISSSFTQSSSKIANIMAEEFNVTCWCGNKTAVLDTINPCPVEPVAGFWKAFSSHFAESGKGNVFWIGDGNRKGGAYQNTSFFTTVEFPKLTHPRVVRLIAIDIFNCSGKMVERCGEGTLKLLQDQAIKKYGSMGYKCDDMCGDPLDDREVVLLANKALQIIREVQHIVN